MDQLACEALVLTLEADAIHHVHPQDAPAFRSAWQGDLHPAEVVVEAVATLGLAPFLVHSTSWRVEDGVVVLSFVVLIEDPGPLPDGVIDEHVDRVELARGHALGPPSDIEAAHVLEHGLRHLAWLVGDDPSIGALLPEWNAALQDYSPEPFRAL